MKSGDKTTLASDALEWQPTQRGVTFTLDELNKLLDEDLTDLLLNTFTGADDRDQVLAVIDGVVGKKPKLAKLLFEAYNSFGNPLETGLHQHRTPQPY